MLCGNEKAHGWTGQGLKERWLRAVRRYFYRNCISCQANCDVCVAVLSFLLLVVFIVARGLV